MDPRRRRRIFSKLPVVGRYEIMAKKIIGKKRRKKFPRRRYSLAPLLKPMNISINAGDIKETGWKFIDDL